MKYRGYIHLKIIPGAADAAIEEAISLATAVSLNIETPGRKHFELLSGKKDYERDIIRPIKLMGKLTGKGTRFSLVKCTTQFIVGASDETDSEIIQYMSGLYNRLNFKRVYFSAYQKGLGDPEIPGEKQFLTNPGERFMASLNPAIAEYLFAGHRSAEPGHGIILEHLGLKPLLDLSMRLGEGTGAALGMFLIESGVKILSEVLSFDDAGVHKASY